FRSHEIEIEISPAWRVWLVVRVFFYLGLVAFTLLFSSAMTSIWPWPIRVLDLRVFMAWVTIVGWGGVVAIVSGRRWPYYKLGLVGTAAIGILQFLGLFINSSPYNWSSPMGVLLPLFFAEWAVTSLTLLYIYRKA